MIFLNGDGVSCSCLSLDLMTDIYRLSISSGDGLPFLSEDWWYWWKWLGLLEWFVSSFLYLFDRKPGIASKAELGYFDDSMNS